MINVPIDRIVPLTDARDNFSRLVAEIENQKDGMYVLTKGGKPAVALVNIEYLQSVINNEALVPKTVPPSVLPKPLDHLENKPNAEKPATDNKPLEKQDAPEVKPPVTPEVVKPIIDPSWLNKPSDKPNPNPAPASTPTPSVNTNNNPKLINPWPIIPPRPTPPPPVPPISTSMPTSTPKPVIASTTLPSTPQMNVPKYDSGNSTSAPVIPTVPTTPPVTPPAPKNDWTTPPPPPAPSTSNMPPKPNWPVPPPPPPPMAPSMDKPTNSLNTTVPVAINTPTPKIDEAPKSNDMPPPPSNPVSIPFDEPPKTVSEPGDPLPPMSNNTGKGDTSAPNSSGPATTPPLPPSQSSVADLDI